MLFGKIVMPALVAGIHVFNAATHWNKDVDGRNKSGHDACVASYKRTKIPKFSSTHGA